MKPLQELTKEKLFNIDTLLPDLKKRFKLIREKMSTNYEIRFDNTTYYVESYTKENNGKCIYLSEEEIRFCGDFSIKKLNKDEE